MEPLSLQISYNPGQISWKNRILVLRYHGIQGRELGMRSRYPGIKSLGLTSDYNTRMGALLLLPKEEDLAGRSPLVPQGRDFRDQELSLEKLSRCFFRLGALRLILPDLTDPDLIHDLT